MDSNDLFMQNTSGNDDMDLFDEMDLFAEKGSSTKGIRGVAEDISGSFATLPSAIAEMLTALPSEAYASGAQLMTDPLRAASNVAGGSVKGLRGFANIPHNTRQYLLEKELTGSAGNPFPYYQETGVEKYLIGGEQKPGDALFRGIGQYMSPYSRIGAGVQGAKGVAQRAGGLGAMGIGDEEMDPIHAAIMGILGEGAAKVPKKAIDIASDVNPFKSAEKKVIKGVELADVEEAVRAADRLGLDYITPGEASGFGYVGKQEGKIGNTLEGSKLREKKAELRDEKIEQVTDNFLNILDDKIELPKEKAALYKEVNAQKLPDSFLGKYIQGNSTVQDAIKLAETKSAYKDKLKGVDKTSFEYWNQIKRILYDMGAAEKRKGKEDLGATIDSTRKELVNEMDSIDPRFKQARKLSERSIVRREIEKNFDKKDMTAKNFYEKVLKSKSNFNEIYDALSEFPEAQQQLRDMRTVYPRLMGTPDAKAAAAGERGGYGTSRSDMAWLARFIEQQFKEQQDINKVKSITSPEWYNTLKTKEAKYDISPLIQKALEDMIKSSAAGAQDENR